MKWIKLFEDFKTNNEQSDLITEYDIIKCIKSGGVIYATIIKDYPNNNPDEPLNPVSIDEDGLITVYIEGDEYSVDIKNIEKIEF
jgi:hypothetical protein